MKAREAMQEAILTAWEAMGRDGSQTLSGLAADVALAAIAAEREAAAMVCPASPAYEKHVQRMIDEGRGTFTDIVRLAEGAFGDGVSRTLAAIRARGAS